MNPPMQQPQDQQHIMSQGMSPQMIAQQPILLQAPQSIPDGMIQSIPPGMVLIQSDQGPLLVPA
eukprot:gene7355-2705_t